MSMKREELRQWFAEWLDDYYDGLYSEDDLTPEVAESALSALRPVSQERVEKVFHGCEMCREKKEVKSDNFCGAATMRIVGDSIDLRGDEKKIKFSVTFMRRVFL